MNEVKALLKFCVGMTVFMAVISAPFLGIWLGVDYFDCVSFRSTGYQTKWNWGCYANVDGQWQPLYRALTPSQELRLRERK
jgi:hypothetical protein